MEQLRIKETKRIAAEFCYPPQTNWRLFARLICFLSLLLSSASLADPSGATKDLLEQPITKMTYAIDHFEQLLESNKSYLIDEIKRELRVGTEFDCNSLSFGAFYDRDKDQIGLDIFLNACSVNTANTKICEIVIKFFRDKAFQVENTGEIFINPYLFSPFHIDDPHVYDNKGMETNRELASKMVIFVSISGTQLKCEAPLLGSGFSVDR